MSLGAADIAFAKELFSEIPDLSTRKMFGGLGIYSEGNIFALMRSDAALLIKAKAGDFADKLADMGCTQWTTTRKSGAHSAMPYWTLPDNMLDDPDAASALAFEALRNL
jgi:DNA transformation protein